MVTPFQIDESLDEKALEGLIDFQLNAGIDGLALCGTTGEDQALSLDDRRRIVALVLERVDSRIPIIVGASANVTARAVALAKETEGMGAAAILSLVPYYNKPNQQGIMDHFMRVADAVTIPVLISNVPGRTACHLTPETALRLAEHENIAGIDEGSGDLELTMAILKDAPHDFAVMSGEDALTFPMIVLGASGTLSIVSNELPAAVKQMVKAALEGNILRASELHYDMLDLVAANYIDSNPMPVKAALTMMGLIEENYRLPLIPLDAGKRASLERELRKRNLIGHNRGGTE